MSDTAPVRFAGIIGQPGALRLLQGFLDADRFPSALLFVGPASVGKRLAARAFAWAASCSSRNGCGACPGCAANAYGEGIREINLAEVFADDQVKVKVDALRTFLAAQATAHALPRRIAFIDRAELLNDAMQGTLLKAIEEPPQRVTYILSAESAAMLAATIRSRTLTIRFQPLASADIAAILQRIDGVGKGAVPPDLLEAALGSVERARALRAAYGDVAELVADVLGKNPPRGTKRAEVQERLALAIPAAAAQHPSWRDALLALDAAVSANAQLGLAWSVFRSAAQAATRAETHAETPQNTPCDGGEVVGRAPNIPETTPRHGEIARRAPGSNMNGSSR